MIIQGIVFPAPGFRYCNINLFAANSFVLHGGTYPIVACMLLGWLSGSAGLLLVVCIECSRCLVISFFSSSMYLYSFLV